MQKRAIAALTAVALAVVGIVLLINYANGANDRAYQGAKLEEVLQVSEPIPANTRASAISGMVKTIQLPSTAIAKGAVKDLGDLKGLSTTVDLAPGEQLLLSRFAAGGAQPAGEAKGSSIPKGTQEVTISVTAARSVAGTLRVGDKIGIVASYQTKEGDGVTQLIRNFVPITRIASAVAGTDATPDGGSQLITLAVKTRDAGKIINAIEFGKVWLTKQNADTETGQGGSISRNDVTG